MFLFLFTLILKAHLGLAGEQHAERHLCEFFHEPPALPGASSFKMELMGAGWSRLRLVRQVMEKLGKSFITVRQDAICSIHIAKELSIGAPDRI